MTEGADAQTVELLFKGRDLGGIGIFGQADAAHKETDPLEGVNQAQHIRIISNAVVTAHLVGHNVLCADDDDNLSLLLQLQKHLQFGVRLKARQHAGCMVIVKQLAAKLQIQLIVKLCNALPDVGRLHGKIFVIIKSNLHQQSPFP